MKAKCINVGTVQGSNINLLELSLGKEYEVLRFSEDCFYIKNNSGHEIGYFKERFEVIEDEEKQEPINERYIRLFPSGAIRSDNRGRERYDWISPLALKELAEYLANTENSFSQVNYYKGLPTEACVESLMRHLNDFRISGNKKEAVGILFNALALVHTIALKERGEYVEHRNETVYMPESEYKEKLKKGEL